LHQGRAQPVVDWINISVMIMVERGHANRRIDLRAFLRMDKMH